MYWTTECASYVFPFEDVPVIQFDEEVNRMIIHDAMISWMKDNTNHSIEFRHCANQSTINEHHPWSNPSDEDGLRSKEKESQDQHDKFMHESLGKIGTKIATAYLKIHQKRYRILFPDELIGVITEFALPALVKFGRR